MVVAGEIESPNDPERVRYRADIAGKTGRAPTGGRRAPPALRREPNQDRLSRSTPRI